MAVLQDLSQAQLIAMVQALQANQKKSGKLRVSEKGCVSIFDGRRMGVHLYAEELLRILDMGITIRQFIDDNKDQLAWKVKPDVA